MPCRSDYMEPTAKERLLRETAQLYAYALAETGERVPERVTQAANNTYCTDDFVAHLCEFITHMDADTRQVVVYNAHNKQSRRLADWWERHQEADRVRQAREQADRVYGENLASAMGKLNAAEIAALRRYFTS